MTRPSRNINRLAYFAAVIEAGSFTAAAARLSITKAVVSQQVAKLEEELGASLVVRTTRRLRPTDAGLRFYEHCATILREVDRAYEQVAEISDIPRGTLRVTAPFDFGTTLVAPAAAAFVARFPGVRIELNLNDQALDLVASRLDLAFRVGWLRDSSHQARRIGQFRQVLVANPAIAARLPVDASPSDLAGLPFVANLALREPLHWSFQGKSERQDVTVDAAIAMDATPAVHAAVLAGGGFSVLPDFLVGDDLAAGKLVSVLPHWALPDGGIYAVFPPARFRPTLVKHFVASVAALRRSVSAS